MRTHVSVRALPFSILSLLAVSATAQRFYDGLLVEVTKKVECSRHTKVGDELTMNYRGTLQSDGSEFDSSIGHAPFKFVLGKGQVIKGWDEGLVGMCIGEGRKLTIPPNLAYGDRDMGKIPPKSTLIFEVSLEALNGKTTNEVEDVAVVSPPLDASLDQEEQKAGSEKGPKHDEDQGSGKCELLGPFALLIQGALGILALMSLVWKRYRETPRRPIKVWAFDASKQVLGSVLLHLANLVMSMFSSGDFDITAAASPEATATAATKFVQDATKETPNPCSFYLLNLAIDTTIGIPILVFLLRILHALFSRTPLAKPDGSLRSGNYGRPPKASWWLKQSLIYFIGLFGMKLCVFLLFQLFPWLGWVGDWALRWTEGKEWVQITFVMLIFPLIMNALQYYIIDSFIKDNDGGDAQANDNEVDQDDEHQGLIGARRDSKDDGGQESGVIHEVGGLKEANPTAVPVEYDSDYERRGGSSSSRNSTAKTSVR